MKLTAEQQYINAMRNIYDTGHDIKNERTGQVCRTLINVDMVYDVSGGEYPLITTRKAPFKIAIAELLGYIRGYTNAAQFRELGTKTWDDNANENEAWLNNPARRGNDDMGMVYGAVGRNWPRMELSNNGSLQYTGENLDLLRKVYANLKIGKDDRGETITFWNPGMFHIGCLRPCLHTHTFSLVNGTLHLTSFQRSNDFPLGMVANMQQCYVLLALMAQITGHKPGLAFHKTINAHIYGNQLEYIPEHLSRIPFTPPKLEINPDIKTLEDLETWVTLDDFKLVGYEHHDPIKYPFSV